MKASGAWGVDDAAVNTERATKRQEFISLSLPTTTSPSIFLIWKEQLEYKWHACFQWVCGLAMNSLCPIESLNSERAPKADARSQLSRRKLGLLPTAASEAANDLPLYMS